MKLRMLVADGALALAASSFALANPFDNAVSPQLRTLFA